MKVISCALRRCKIELFCLTFACWLNVWLLCISPKWKVFQPAPQSRAEEMSFFWLTSLQAAVAAVTFKYLTLSFLLSWGMAFIITLKRRVKVQLLISLWQIIITPRNYINTAMVDQTDIMTSLTALPFSSQTFTEEQQTLKLEDQLQDYNWQTGRTHWKAFKK